MFEIFILNFNIFLDLPGPFWSTQKQTIEMWSNMFSRVASFGCLKFLRY